MFKNTAPTILIANGANLLGVKLTEVLLEQGSNIIMLDEYDESRLHFAKHFRKNKNFLFLERDSFDVNKKNINRLSYTFVLLHQNATEENEVSTKEFISNTQFLDSIFEFTQFKKAKSVLVTSLHNYKRSVIENDSHTKAYSFYDVQRHAEKIAYEYTQELNLNNRIVRIGNLFGPEMDVEEDSVITRMCKEALTQDYVTINGDGLEFDYYLYASDAVYGIVKAIFDESTKGKTYFAAYSEPISHLAIANKILQGNVRAKGLKFFKNKKQNEPLFEQAIVPENSLTEIDWEPSMDIEEGLNKTLEYVRAKIGIDRIKTPAKSTMQSEDSEDNFIQRAEKKIEDNEDVVIVNVPKTSSNSKHKYAAQKNIHVKTRIFVLFLILALLAVFYFTAVIPITSANSTVESQTNVLSQLNSSLDKKNLNDAKSALNKVEIENLDTRIKSLSILSNIIGQKNTYDTYVKAFASYQSYISALQKITASSTISALVFQGQKIDNQDILTVQTINQIKSDLNDSINSLKNTSIDNIPQNTKKELGKMNEISRNLLEVLVV